MAILTKYYQDAKTAQVYQMGVTYERCECPRGYYVKVRPVNVRDVDGYYSILFDFSRVVYGNEKPHKRALLNSVTRASASAQARAIERAEALIQTFAICNGLELNETTLAQCATREEV